ncbi:MAG: hypothetical protein H7Z38_13430 [Rubrivivax sp.]|nr:hypothetical protein [Pyrinomonadaceae bacterium]
MDALETMQDRITRALMSSGLEESKAKEAAFHMADWKEDADTWVGIWADSNELNDEQLARNIYKFLAHVPNHLAAAKKLVGLGPIEDIFKIGVLEEDEDS